ncbi:MAG: hypothetical protein P4L46_10375 [Fimbriimonas sp.]|nr:hypothetical protein [Fimbriimonas sp.]
MPFDTSVTLPDVAVDARASFQQYLDDPRRGILLVLGGDQGAAFGLAETEAGKPSARMISAIWAKDPDAIQAQVTGLSLADGVSFSAGSTKLVAINRVKTIELCLDAEDAVDGPSVLFAVTAAGTDQ